ncbi:MAG: hypothetical protein BHV69_04400 [Bacteroidales bacterium 52_46]|nr:MAG: hypothetical protein BHV69_04400 [Bacteroidales bacterium 52_46]
MTAYANVTLFIAGKFLPDKNEPIARGTLARILKTMNNVVPSPFPFSKNENHILPNKSSSLDTINCKMPPIKAPAIHNPRPS